MKRLLAPPLIGIYLASVLLANWLTTHYGFIDVGFGQAATAGTFAAGPDVNLGRVKAWLRGVNDQGALL